MKFCTNCGSQLPDESVFCTHCGASLNTEANSQPASAGFESAAETAPTVGAFGAEQSQATPAQPAQPTYQEPVYQQPQQPAYQPAQPQQMPQGVPMPQQPYNPQQPDYTAPQQPYNQPQGQPTYQTNAYNYAPPQQPVEEKANIGLAILSFFIPLVGLILFLTQKDKKPKTAKACGLAALISFVLGIIFSIIASVAAARLAVDNYDDFDSIVDDYGIDDILEEDDEDAVIYGTFDENGYQNTYFNIFYNLPENWRFQTYEEIASDDIEYSFDDETGVPYAEDGANRIYYDSTAENEETYGKIITGVIQKGGDITSREDVLDYFIDKDDEEITDITEYTTKYVAGCEFLCCDVTYDSDGFGMYAGYYVTEKNGNFFLIYNFTTDYEDNKPADYLEYFY